MTPDESELLQSLGFEYLYDVETLSISVFFYGVFVVLFSASIVIIMRRRSYPRATVAMFAISGLSFLLATLYVATVITAFVQVIRKTLVDNIDDALSERANLAKEAAKSYNIIMNWSLNLPELLSNLVVIWRASVLFPDHQQWVILGPLSLWLATVATDAAYLIWTSTTSGYQSYESYSNGFSNRYLALFHASLGLSLATNAITTAMIVYKLWTYRTNIMKNLHLKASKNPTQNVLIFLVESGLVYLGFQIANLVLTLLPHPEIYETLAFVNVYGSLAALYPTIVIVLVITQRSVADICEINPSNPVNKAVSVSEQRAATFGHLSFAAARPAESVSDSISDQPQWPEGLKGPEGLENWKAA